MEHTQPSFLSGKDDRYHFTRMCSYPLLDLFKNSAEMVLTQRFVKEHRDSLQTVMFEFEVTIRNKKWRIIKKFQDFVDLKRDLQMRYMHYLMDFPVEDTT
jgi:hypothetical protein